MDPLTALQVAGTILTFVDFGSKLLSATSEFYKNGVSPANEVIEFAIGQVSTVATKLLHSEDLGPDLEQVCAKTNELAAELLGKLESLKIKEQKKVWGSFQKAIETVWTRDEISELQARIRTLREAMDTRILVSLRENMSLMSKQHSERFDHLDTQTQQILRALLEIQNARSTAATAMADRPNFQAIDVQLRALSTMLGRLAGNTMVDGNPASSMYVGLQEGAESFEHQQETRPGQLLRLIAPTLEDENLSRTAFTNDLLSKTLPFASMTNRYEQVKEAYPDTYGWVFVEPDETSVPFSSFVSWLRDDETGVYWVNGKAGSGKSTLMRFIFDDKRTANYLRSWAARSQRPLCIASYFFWNSGTAQQKSREGLLRTLLYQVLSQHPNLVPVVMPSAWSSWYNAFTLSKPLSFEFNLKQLLDVLDRLATQTISPLYLCFLIDGLDEFDGDHQELSELIIRLSNLQSVKICVSSRPWIDYSHAFGKFSGLKLQDLTYHDIEVYVRGKVEQHPQFQLLEQEEPEATTNLISEIIVRADGVFLWVTIVVKSLLRGISNLDGIPDLLRRLREFPREIEPLYQHMFGLIDSFYLESSSQLFQIYRAYRDHASSFQASALHLGSTIARKKDLLSALSLYYASRFKTDEECICRQNLPSAQACSLNIDAQLVVRCAGLLEIVKPISGGDYVEYLHRTAREFVESPPIWKKILGYTAETDFNADASLLRSYICQIGSHIGSQVESDIYTLQNIINLATVAMLHAYFADSATSNARADLLNHMDETMKELPVFTKYFPKKHWTAYTTWNAPASIDKMDSISFLTHAIQWDLAAYVEHTVTSSTIRPDLGPLIPYIAWSGITGRLREYNMSFNISPRTGSFLLQLCTKSNQKLEGIMVSPWKRVLLACYYQEVEMNEQSRKQHQTEVVSLLEQFVLGGASLQLQILPSDLDGRSPFRRPTKVLLYLLYIFQRSGFPVEVTENFIRQMTKLHGSKRARVKSLLGKLVSR